MATAKPKTPRKSRAKPKKVVEAVAAVLDAVTVPRWVADGTGARFLRDGVTVATIERIEDGYTWHIDGDATKKSGRCMGDLGTAKLKVGRFLV